MSLISIHSVDASTVLGCWKIEENPDNLLAEWPHLRPIVEKIHSRERMSEKLCAYCLLYAMTGRNDFIISHNSDGKPLLDGWHVSITDTRGLVAVILSKKHEVGIDIEYMSSRVQRIASRFIRPDEQSDSLVKMLLNWSAKETAFKYFSADKLLYFEMRLRPFQPLEEGILEVEHLRKPGTVIRVGYRVCPEYVLTWSVD